MELQRYCKPEFFTTFLFSRLSRIRKIREIKKSGTFYLFSISDSEIWGVKGDNECEFTPMKTSSTVYTCKIAFNSSKMGYKIIIFHWNYYFHTSIESQDSPL